MVIGALIQATAMVMATDTVWVGAEDSGGKRESFIQSLQSIQF